MVFVVLLPGENSRVIDSSVVSSDSAFFLAFAPIVVQLKFVHFVKESVYSTKLESSALVVSAHETGEVWISPMWGMDAGVAQVSQIDELLGQLLKAWAALREPLDGVVLGSVFVEGDGLLST